MKSLAHRDRFFPLIAALCLPGLVCTAQQPAEHPDQPPAQAPIGRTSATMVQIAGAVDLHDGEALLGNGSTVTAESQPVKIALTRGGSLRLCSTTSLHLAEDRSIAAPASTALMMALDRGALETDYAVGKYSDVLLTPDLRILISGPGDAALSIRVNTQGDTCLDNHGINAPYVTVTSQFDGGLYRVLPNQRVTFEHGSLNEVVDNETEPCGCPVTPPVAVASAAAPANNTPGNNTFPIAVSEQLVPPPSPASKPVVPSGEAHAEVTVPLTYNGEHPAATLSPQVVAESAVPPTPASGVPAAGSAPQPSDRQAATGENFFHRVGHFFSRIFGG